MAKKALIKIEEKYTVADKLHSAYIDLVDTEKLKDDKPYRNYIFGILLHTPNANGQELIDVYNQVHTDSEGRESSDAMHIVNLTLKRFGNSVTIITVDF
ncbi:MAG: hypothetical protein DRQ78_09070 [Epsilonproteobacteria bacterium]|nr:MAG: hypothetical protein DRQ78_09070 [Campylobacterota bacterium]